MKKINWVEPVLNNTATKNTYLYKEINNKMETMLGMYNQSILSIDSQKKYFKTLW